MDLLITFLGLILCQIAATAFLVYALVWGHILVSRQEGGLFLSLTSQIMMWTLVSATIVLYISIDRVIYLLIGNLFNAVYILVSNR